MKTKRTRYFRGFVFSVLLYIAGTVAFAMQYCMQCRITAIFFLLLLSVPMIIFARLDERQIIRKMEQQNSRLRQDMVIEKEREESLKDAIHDLERFNAVSEGRESRIIELKSEVNDLLEQMNKEKRYNIDKMD